MPPTFRDLIAAKLNLLPQAIYDAFPASLAGKSLLIANRNELFVLLEDQPKSAEEIASALSFEPHATGLMLDLLTTAGYLSRHKEHYALTPQSRKWLLRSSPAYIGNFLRYIEMLHEHWLSLEQTLKNGTPSISYVDRFDQRDWKIYVEGMSDLARFIMPYLLPKLKISSKAERLLDLGGSHGLYSAKIIERHKSLSGTIIDYPEVLEETKRLPHIRELGEQITLQSGDIRSGDFGVQGYDAVLAFNIIHGFDSWDNERLFYSIANSLRNDGQLYILDQLKPEKTNQSLSSLVPAAVGLNLLNEIGGSVYSFADVKKWCGDAGLTKIKRQKLKLPGVVLVRAIK